MAAPGPEIHLCFVCLGNICRSPTAAGIMEHLLREAGLEKRVHVDSAGTGAWHVGEPPDRRSSAEAHRRGIELPGSARRFTRADFGRFDYVLAMDASNHGELEALAPDAEALARLHFFLAFDPSSEPTASVPDPYNGGPNGFADVFDLCETACRGLLAHLRGEHGLD